ncbi:MAG: hypothetical protein MIO92_15535 [Methanosarcinaceae archaeon]|nr:hypothetical protein [Methanosarcinaceae archaeon]
MLSHNEHCQDCKIAFLNTLRELFGEVIAEWSSGFPCKLKDVLALPNIGRNKARTLNRIYTTLQNHRGYKGFDHAHKLPPCDHYVPSLNCLIEFDESQHFTAPRALTLSLYSKDLKLGYDRTEWFDRSKSLDRHDNSPPDRDETRAWYDALRDLLPESLGMNPTVRVYAKDAVWCEDDEITKRTINEIIRGYKMNIRMEKSSKRKSIDFGVVGAAHVKKAMRDINKTGSPDERGAVSTVLHYSREHYPAKYVLGEAYRIATGIPLKPDDYTGGDTTAKILADLGFEIIKNGKQWRLPKGRAPMIFRVLLKGSYDRAKRQHINPKFSQWVDKKGNMIGERMDCIFNALIEQYGSIENSISIFPACTVVIRDQKVNDYWRSKLRKLSKRGTLVMGVLDKTRSRGNKEYTAVYSGGVYSELSASYPEHNLPVGDGWVYISSNIDNHMDNEDPGKYCFDLGHGAYDGHYGHKLKKSSRETGSQIILTSWYKSYSSFSWIYAAGKSVFHDVDPIVTEYGDIVEKLKDSYVKTLFR